jgi:mRNA-decapping enzyme subunit 2
VKNALPPPDMMVDLASRFVLNAPAEELRSFERMLFLIEQVRALTIPTTLSMVQP